MTKKNICIIGSGIGGLSAAVLLLKKGHNVTVYERENMIGGRTLSFELGEMEYKEYFNLLKSYNMNIAFSEPDIKNIFEKKMLEGYHLDLGYHLIGGGIIDKLSEILSISNKEIEILKSRLYEQKNGDYGYFLTGFEKIKMLPNILRLFLASEKTMTKLDVTSISKTIKIYGKGKMKKVLEVNSRLITTVNNLDVISTGEVFRTQKDMGLKGVRYPIKGLSYFIDKFSDHIKERGGYLFLNSAVTKINIKNNKAVGVVVNGEEKKFDVVISNILVQDLYKIIDEKKFPKDYIKNLRSLKGSGSLCAYYSFNKIDTDLIGKTFVFQERELGVDGRDAAGMIDFMISNPKTGVAPPSNYIVQSYIVCTPSEALDKKMLQKLRYALDKNLEKIIPDYKANLNWCFYPAIWHLDGVAKTIDNEKPDIKTPVENLFLIGDCVKAPGIGVNCAINSARLLSESY